MFKVAVICGGPSLERGISLNSARSVLDHLSGEDIQILPLYVDSNKNFYEVSPSQLYSNTPGDFDFKLAKPLNQAEIVDFFNKVDLTFPVIHGKFGEDGELQALLERLNVPFVGSGSQSCRSMYDKQAAKKVLQEHGYPVLPSVCLSGPDRSLIEQFFVKQGKAVVKPVCGGSSIGVFIVGSAKVALEKCEHLFEQGHKEVLLEAYCIGCEFTVLVLENSRPVALIPTEIEMDYSHNEIFDYRRKYLPTNSVAYHTPPRFDEEVILEIREKAEAIFRLFQMRDFVRLDGWVAHDGTLYFTDINPVSGLEQNSFFFRQAASVGLSHVEALSYVVKNAASRYALEFPEQIQNTCKSRQPVFVLFGGSNAERQVSLMSGTNIWLKLQRSSLYQPMPFFYDCRGDIWQLPYGNTLDHTVEEIYENCINAEERAESHAFLIEAIQSRLEIEPSLGFLPRFFSLEQFLTLAQKQSAFVFIAMHGGIGENGTLQRVLEQYQIPYNGSDAAASALCMDKFKSGEAVRQLFDPDILSLPKRGFTSETWDQLTLELGSERLIAKPRCDGCSAGIALLQSESDYKRYLHLLELKAPFIPPQSFANQNEAVEMPSSDNWEFILEPFIETDAISIRQNRLNHTSKQGWIELTVGVLEELGSYHAFNPSITVADGAVLSLEEKFQGGTGVNLTPPPEEILSAAAVEKVKRMVEKIARALCIRNYARLDIFFNRFTEKLIFIEANTLPGLTPSTVFYHQGLAEDPPLGPTALLEKIISSNALCVRL